MKTLVTCLFFGLLVGCGSPELPRAINWKFDVWHDERDQPRGKVWLLVDGQRHLITNDPVGGYRIIGKKEYPQVGVPRTAVLACTAWSAGIGEDMYVRVEANRVLVYRREYGETLSGMPPYSLLRTIPIQANQPPQPIGISSSTGVSSATSNQPNPSHPAARH
jgi:hypothetical protein